MFRAQLDELASRYADRLEIMHVLSREPHRNPLLTGRIDREKLTALLESSLRLDDVGEWFLCGPLDLVASARETLVEHGVDPDHVHVELFHGYAPAEREPRVLGAEPCAVTIRLSGEQAEFTLAGGDSILEGALRIRSDVPYACMGGACGTCRAKLVEGEVRMERNFALDKNEVANGFVLTCQAHPLTPHVVLSFDER